MSFILKLLKYSDDKFPILPLFIFCKVVPIHTLLHIPHLLHCGFNFYFIDLVSVNFVSLNPNVSYKFEFTLMSQLF